LYAGVNLKQKTVYIQNIAAQLAERVGSRSPE
jgi:hypothetical protein